MVVRIKGGDKLEAHLRELARKVKKKAVLKVGFPENATYPDGISLPLVAAVHNFGAPSRGIPPRPFLSNTVAKGKDHWGDDIAKVLKATGYDAEKALQLFGEQVKGEIQQSILETNSPPLKPATIARKGSSKPLIDTGFMIKNVTSKVET